MSSTGRESSPGTPPPPAPPGPRVVSVRSLMGDAGLGIELTLLAGEAGLDRPIRHSRIQKSGLALVGHFHGIVPGRVQILGGPPEVTRLKGRLAALPH